MPTIGRAWGLVAIATILVQSSSSVSIVADKLLIVLSIDARKEGYMLDTLLLLRSLRQFGGSLNQADIRAAIICSHGALPHATGNLTSFIQQLHAFAVNTIVRPQFSPLLFPTTNKLRAFESLPVGQYAHVLYMDTDVFVLRDPLEDFNMEAEVLCVPSAASYMDFESSTWLLSLMSIDFSPRRMWGHAIEDHHLLHVGSCNTGVLFMTIDAARQLYQASVSLIDEVTREVFERHPQYEERIALFIHLDSWALCVSLYQLGLEVGRLGTEYNFFVSHQGQLQERRQLSSPAAPIKLLHFVGVTYFSVSMRPDCSGVCQSELRILDDGDVVQKELSRILDEHTCRSLAGCNHLLVDAKA
jgi:hypothetical protein